MKTSIAIFAYTVVYQKAVAKKSEEKKAAGLNVE